MPYIFPRRFLRNKDILDPFEFQHTYDESKSLADEGIDRHNIQSVQFKSLGSNPIDVPDKPNVGIDAYYSIHDTRVEVRNRTEYGINVWRNHETNDGRSTLNFVEPDGQTFRDGDIDTGILGGKPYVVPHTGEWSTVQNKDLSGPLRVSFETKGQSNLWVCAYLQYVWQGFFELKDPWVPSQYKGWKKSFSLDLGGATDIGWANAFSPAKQLAEEEMHSLNNFGPSMAYTAYYAAIATGADDLNTVAVPYSFPLNEMTAHVESAAPFLGGYHHISRGHYPCLVQFALRVDGEIIDETITGKQFTSEESAHGLRVQNGPVIELDDSDGSIFDFRGQRSHQRDASYGSQLALSTAGQKIRRSRAVALGPEVQPIRIGSVIPIDPGEHTVEIVARRLSYKKKDFETGDFVGVFSRRIVAIELPTVGSVTSGVDFNEAASVSPYETESVLSKTKLGSIPVKQTSTAKTFNSISNTLIRPNSIPNTHLPSKIEFSARKSITTHATSTTDPLVRGQGTILEPPVKFTSAARFPGFLRSDSVLNQLTQFSGGPGDTIDDGTWFNRNEYSAGWDFIRDSSSTLSISGDLSVTSGKNSLLLLADIELLQLNGIESSKVSDAIANSAAGDVRAHSNYLSHVQHDKYLDILAYFAIGYKTTKSNDSWIIASNFRPAVVNSNRWANRSDLFTSEVGDNLKVGTFISVDQTAGGTGANDYSFTIIGNDTESDRRGMNTRPSGYGINVPLMVFIDDTVSITEVAVFTCTTFPSVWDQRHTAFGADSSSDARKELGETVHETWKSPVYGRGILSGAQVMWGDCSLSAIKFKR